MSSKNRMKKSRFTAMILAFILAAACLPAAGAFAQDSGNIVRVGWYESPYNITDENGRRSGYAYDYQQKVSAYTGWTYEYVEGTWPELLQMLKEGRIDLLSDVSYTEERTESMLYSNLPMGAEEYYIYTAPDNKEISKDDLSTFNGKKVGVDKGSIQVNIFRAWAEENDVRVELVEMTDPVTEAFEMLNRGTLDMYIALNAYMSLDTAVPILNIGASEFYFAVSKSRPELLPELNTAMERILEQDRYYNDSLYSKYISSIGVNLFLDSVEQEWLDAHGPVRVGYQDNYLAFCACDPKTGELTGALKDYLNVASDCLENAHIDFETYVYPTASDALAALKNGDLDCVFPANLTDYDGEVQGLYMTPALMRTDMSAIVRKEDLETFSQADHITVAVNTGNTNYDIFLEEHFPDWRSVYFEDTPECLKAVAERKADCLLISNYRYNNISELCEKYDLAAVSTGVEMDYCLAVDRDSNILYSILSKVTGGVPDATVNSLLSYYFTEDAKNDLGDLIRKNIALVVCVFAVLGGLIVFLLLRGRRAAKKAGEEQKLISATETDAATGLYTRSYFYEFIDRMHREEPEKMMDAVVLNIEHFHSVNAVNGHGFGDQIIRELADEIRSYLEKHDGIGCHTESDHFAMYCSHLEDPRSLFDLLQGRLDSMASNTAIQLRMGVMPWQQDMGTRQMMDQARIACSMARGYYNEHLVVFDNSVREREAYEHRLESDLTRALENRELEVYYQPIFDIRTVPPEPAGAEALVRWKHPELGMITPGDFIPLFERKGRIGEIDKYVWTEAARQAAEWKEKYGAAIPVSVNLSRPDLFDPELDIMLESLLEKYGLGHGDFRLEVTESACMESPYQVADILGRLRKKGFEIEMDNFGSGYSSLNMLSMMPIDVLKMDRTFVINVDHNEKDLQLAELILGIAKKLDLPVIAVGVESENQLKILKDMGCGLVQGFCYSRPLPASEFESAFMNRRS